MGIKRLKRETFSTDYAPGTMGCHEALHMASFLSSAVDTELAQHPAILGNQEWSELASKAVKILGELYQKIGEKHLE